ncbi:carboxymuconolactone decarboxylase family protein [Asanoa sp. NPDC049518]|uniref:carboxymuconolactone decarboxylase family protein n=1 Tax=unclassified Asanoa TaxID=2685164 RepID=UPI00341B27B5
MAHIDLGFDEKELPGISGLLRYRPLTGGPLAALADALLTAPNSLSRGERELIAAQVSARNECGFCRDSHAAAAAAQLEPGMSLVEQVRADPATAPISDKLRALLRLADVVREDGRAVTPSLVDDARAAGATDVEIHDTVLIAAAFCMFNRYVDGLGTVAPDDPAAYAASAQRIVAMGYGRPA